jgi:hypothetical protein
LVKKIKTSKSFSSEGYWLRAQNFVFLVYLFFKRDDRCFAFSLSRKKQTLSSYTGSTEADKEEKTKEKKEEKQHST